MAFISNPKNEPTPERDIHPAIAALFPLCTASVISAGLFLFRQGDRADRVFLIRQGRLQMRRQLACGQVITMQTGRPGELFAEGALFTAIYHCEAQAAEESVVASCPKREAQQTLAQSPVLALAWIERVTQQLHAARSLLELRNLRSAEGRVMQHLHLRADPAGEVFVEGRLLDFADELGLTHEAYYRSLAGLQRSGRISRGRRIIRLSRSSNTSLTEDAGK